MEKTVQYRHESNAGLLKEVVPQITDLFIQAAERHLDKEDPLRSRIIRYYSRPSTKQELFHFLAQRNQEEILSYRDAVRQSANNASTFVERMEKLYELQDTRNRRRELATFSRPATDDEYKLGAYADVLESQVRDAVLAAQKKGYRTFQSGFSEKSDRDQFMDFYNRHLTIPESALNYARARSIQVTVEMLNDRTTLTLHPVGKDPIRLTEWKEIWDTFIQLLPLASPEMVPSMHPTGEHATFRKAQDGLRNRSGIKNKIAALLRYFK